MMRIVIIAVAMLFTACNSATYYEGPNPVLCITEAGDSLIVEHDGLRIYRVKILQ